jgi:hypothetical protein
VINLRADLLTADDQIDADEGVLEMGEDLVGLVHVGRPVSGRDGFPECGRAVFSESGREVVSLSV